MSIPNYTLARLTLAELNAKLIQIGRRVQNVSIDGVMSVDGLTLPSGPSNQVIATPNGVTGESELRALVAADIPNLSASKITTGQLAAARGGTGLDTSGSTGVARISSGTWSANAETGSGKVVFDTSPTIVTPTIASFTNATHNHTNAAGGGQITTAALSDYVAPTAFTPSITPSAGTWTGQSVQTAKYGKIGKTLTIWIVIGGTTSTNCTLSMTVPNSYSAATTTVNIGRSSDDSGATWQASPAVGSGTSITFNKTLAGGSFAAGAVSLQFTVIIEVS